MVLQGLCLKMAAETAAVPFLQDARQWLPWLLSPHPSVIFLDVLTG